MEVNFFNYLNQRVFFICKESLSPKNVLKILISSIFSKALAHFIVNSSLEGPLKGLYLSKERFKVSILQGVFYQPVGEELFFRGGMLVLIREIQLVYFKFIVKKKANQKELQRAEQARVRFVAFIFGFFHLWNIYRSFQKHLLKIALTAFSGLAFGYLSERCQSSYLAIFAHSVNNGFSYWLTYKMSRTHSKQLTEMVVLCGSIAIKSFFYLYAIRPSSRDRGVVEAT